MTLEQEPDAPESVIAPAERIHEYLADTFGPDDVLVTVESSGAVQTTIAEDAGVEYPGEWNLDEDPITNSRTDAA